MYDPEHIIWKNLQYKQTELREEWVGLAAHDSHDVQLFGQITLINSQWCGVCTWVITVPYKFAKMSIKTKCEEVDSKYMYTLAWMSAEYCDLWWVQENFDCMFPCTVRPRT